MTMAAVLKERARAGVRVLFVLDAFGSQNLKREWADSLRINTRLRTGEDALMDKSRNQPKRRH